MRNTRTGKVVVYNPYLIEEMPWYEPILDEEPQPEQPQQEAAAAEKPKRKTWKDAMADKAKELEGNPNEEASVGEAQPEQAEQATDAGAEGESKVSG